MQNSKLTVTSSRSPSSGHTVYRVSLPLNDVVNATYELDDQTMMMFQPRGAGGGSFGMEFNGLRDMVLRQLEHALQDFVRDEIAHKFANLRNQIGA